MQKITPAVSQYQALVDRNAQDALFISVRAMIGYVTVI